MSRAALIAFLLACGSKPAPKSPPPPSPAVTLAKQLDADMTILAELARRHRGNCPALTAELRPHVDQMKQHATEVEQMTADPIKTRELKAELSKYDQTSARTDQIAQDLGATYVACKDAPDQRHALERVIADIPTY